MNLKIVIILSISLLCIVNLRAEETPVPQDKHKIAYMGSSVAYGAGAENDLGWAYMYTNLLKERYGKGLSAIDWKTSNISVGGNSTTALLKRWEKDLPKECSRYVLYGLSLGNEGIHDKGEPAFHSYHSGMQKAIAQARETDIIPVVSNNYTRADFNAADYEFVKKMNLMIHEWDVPSINTLGAIDDGFGRWAAGYENDPAHPNTAGHQEFFYAIVPSLFDALDAQKPLPVRMKGTSYKLNKNEQIEFIPENIVHPFTISFDVKTQSAGVIVSFEEDKGIGYLKIDGGGNLIYESPQRQIIKTDIPFDITKWNRVTLTHYYARGVTMLYVNNQKSVELQEKLLTKKFILGGCNASENAGYRELFFWRSGMNAEEIACVNDDKMMKSSLEIYAPLGVKGKNPLVNLAQSTNIVRLRKLEPPMMGWSSWNANFLNINEALLKETADHMIALGLKEVGYQWVNTDDGFLGGRDSSGHLIVNSKFPRGMKVVADYIHSKGLKAGIYSEAGDNTCGSYWPGDPQGIGVGLYGYEKQDLNLFFKDWGYEFIKIDYCGAVRAGLDEKETYTKIGRIIEEIEQDLGRDIKYNICRWSFPGTWAASVADSWRMRGDISDNFESIKGIIEDNIYLAPYASPGKYNDMDMLQVGRGLNIDEEKTHFGMWSIMNSPLIIGCNLKGVRQSTLDIVKNKEVIAVNQDALGLQAELVARTGNCMVFAKPIEVAHGNIRAVALFNTGDSEQLIRVSFKDLQLNENAIVRDLWNQKNVGSFNGYYETKVPAHGTAMLRIEGKSSFDKTLYEGEYAYMNTYTAIKKEGARFVKAGELASGGYKMGWLGNSPENWAEFRDVYSSAGGKYTLNIFYYCGEDRNLSVLVNGKEYQLKKLNSGGFNQRAETSLEIELKKGSNVICLANPTDWAPDIDKIELVSLIP